jgi:hypothetical protein
MINTDLAQRARLLADLSLRGAVVRDIIDAALDGVTGLHELHFFWACYDRYIIADADAEQRQARFAPR